MEKPILFNTEMVQAILEGRKTSTRRIIKSNSKTPNFYGRDKFYKLVNQLNREIALFAGFYKDSDIFINEGKECIDAIYFKAPYQVGDALYVRETWSFQTCSNCGGKCDVKAPDYFKEDGCYVYRTNYGSTEDDTFPPSMFKWHPSIHMPRVATRLFLKVTDVRVERLQDITEEEALKEGIDIEEVLAFPGSVVAKDFFEGLWDSLYKNWSENPWVWVIEFERVENYK